MKTETGEIMIFEPGQHARALLGDASRHSEQAISREPLEQIERQGGSWADLLGVTSAAA